MLSFVVQRPQVTYLRACSQVVCVEPALSLSPASFQFHHEDRHSQLPLLGNAAYLMYLGTSLGRQVLA